MDEDGELYGVKGWLLFLVLVLIIFGPALSAWGIYSELAALEQSDPEFAATVDFEDTSLGAWIVWGFSGTFSVAAGLLLAVRLKPSSVWFAIGSLWVFGPILNGLLLWDIYSIGEEIDANLWVAFARTIVPAAAWSAYLLCSERVSNTYSFRRRDRS